MSNIQYSAIFGDTQKRTKTNILLAGAVVRLDDIFVYLTKNGNNVTVVFPIDSSGVGAYRPGYAQHVIANSLSPNSGNFIAEMRKANRQPKIDSVVYFAEKDIMVSEDELTAIKRMIEELWSHDELAEDFNLVVVGFESGISKEYEVNLEPSNRVLIGKNKSEIPNYNIMKIVYNNKSLKSGLESNLLDVTSKRDLNGNFLIVEDSLVKI
ncbi:hypothetical protein [Lysinibacillus xylanilyticus]|uniref:hypothetical protein n=1 Tax=Lysinibacillus xylanilyticus TaxID=582475 RepID=UPI0036D94E11